MSKKISLDKFRVFVAILIVAIHTFPLISINKDLNFAFTEVFCRIGVPFFLMVTGYFVLPKAIKSKELLVKYTIKIIKMYAICTILYLPLSIYAGKFKNAILISILKQVFITGTYIHLWYFPGLILGIWLTYYIIKTKKPFVIVLILYIIGLYGDSYYGISEKSEIMKNFYNIIFNIFDYTRNGIFFVPIFIYLGYYMKNNKLNISERQNWLFTIVFTVLMIIEGLILHHLNLQKHTSMYIMLVPTMIFLFNLLIQKENENNRKLRSISTIIYIAHPMFIIIIRVVAKVLHLTNLMIDNSIINYICVVLSTVIFSVVFENIKIYLTKQ